MHATRDVRPDDAASVLRREMREGIALLTLHRPHVRNALDPQLLRALMATLEEIETAADVHAVVITGTGAQAFSAGADIAYLNRATPLAVRDFARLAVAVNHRLETLGKVTIAAINGCALGGGLELAEACALRLAAPHASFGHPEVRLGAIAGFGGTTRLARLIGRGRATELLLTGRVIDAQEAERLGLINAVHPAATLLAQAEALVREIRAQAPIAVRLTAEALRRGLDMSVAESAALGADYFGLAATSEDFRTGTTAFLEKRTPQFRGK